jgi:hypothetical protein
MRLPLFAAMTAVAILTNGCDSGTGLDRTFNADRAVKTSDLVEAETPEPQKRAVSYLIDAYARSGNIKNFNGQTYRQILINELDQEIVGKKREILIAQDLATKVIPEITNFEILSNSFYAERGEYKYCKITLHVTNKSDYAVSRLDIKGVGAINGHKSQVRFGNARWDDPIGPGQSADISEDCTFERSSDENIDDLVTRLTTTNSFEVGAWSTEKEWSPPENPAICTDLLPSYQAQLVVLQNTRATLSIK